jgi:hypothetical protein
MVILEKNAVYKREAPFLGVNSRLQTASETHRQWSFLACSLTSGNKLSVGQGIFDLGNNQFGGTSGCLAY